MRQRVGFARALVVEPEILFMDEPFSALDVLTAANLRKELLGLWRERKIPIRAILMVTHNIDEAVSMADRILVLGANPGRIRVELPGLPIEQRSIPERGTYRTGGPHLSHHDQSAGRYYDSVADPCSTGTNWAAHSGDSSPLPNVAPCCYRRYHRTD